MIGMPEGVRKLLVAYDVAGYGGRGKRQQFAVQRRLVEVLGYALSEARVNGHELQEQGDGGLGLLPTGAGVDEPRVIAALITALETGLAEMNEELVTAARIRLRVALDEGIVHRAAHGFTGPAVTGVSRLRDADVVRQALADSDADLVVVVADRLYQDAVAGGPPRGSVFIPVSVTAKEFCGPAWVYLSAGSGGGPSRPVPPPASGPAAVPQHPESPERPRGTTPAEPPNLARALDMDPRTW